MKKFPQFLKSVPDFMGLSFLDLPLIMAGLCLGLIFKLEGITAILISFALIIIRKFILSKIDLVGFMLPRAKTVEIKVRSNQRGHDDTNI